MNRLITASMLVEGRYLSVRCEVNRHSWEMSGAEVSDDDGETWREPRDSDEEWAAGVALDEVARRVREDAEMDAAYDRERGRA